MVSPQNTNTLCKIFLTDHAGRTVVELFFFESESEAIAAAHVLENLGGRAKKLLAECIEHQSITRKSISEAAKALENEGFIFIKESDDLFDKSVEMKPSLWGEEAMATLEFIAQKSPNLIDKTF
jgi:DNA-binding MarR family transcriptional regulator